MQTRRNDSCKQPTEPHQAIQDDKNRDIKRLGNTKAPQNLRLLIGVKALEVDGCFAFVTEHL